MAKTHSYIMREVDQRENAGLLVTMWYFDEDKSISITVTDKATEEEFEFDNVPPGRAYEVFYHPFAFHHKEIKAKSALTFEPMAV